MQSSAGVEHARQPRWRRSGSRSALVLVLIGLGVSAVFMWLAARDADPERTWEAFTRAETAWLAASVGLMVVAFFIRAARWWSLFEPGRRPPLRQVVRATFVGYVGNNLLPVRAGDAAKAVALNRMARTPVAESVATIVTERVYDVLSLIALLFLMLPWLPEVTWLRAAGALAACVVVAVGILVAIVLRFGQRPVRAVLRPLTWLPFVPEQFSERAATQFVDGLVGLLKPRIAAVAFSWTVGSWLVLGLAYWLVTVGFDLGVSPLAGELVVIGIGLAMVLPSSPAAVGVFEAATVVVLDAYGIDASTALSYALVLHALNIVPLLVVAGGALVARRFRRHRQAPDATAVETASR